MAKYVHFKLLAQTVSIMQNLCTLSYWHR